MNKHLAPAAAKPRQPAVIEKKAVSAMAVLDPSCSTAPSKAPPRSGLAVKQSKAPQRESVGTASKKRDGDTVTAKVKPPTTTFPKNALKHDVAHECGSLFTG